MSDSDPDDAKLLNERDRLARQYSVIADAVRALPAEELADTLGWIPSPERTLGILRGDALGGASVVRQ